jgi:large subunit ribosomal protein L10
MERKSVVRKKKEVEKLTEKLEKAISFYIVDYTGLDANAMNNLRGEFRSNEYEYFVIKNSILQRASEKLGFEEIKEVLAGPNSISISYDDPIGPARIINDYYKKTELPKVKLCFIEGKWFTSKEVKRLADLPSREVLIAQLLNLMVSPVSRLVGLMSNLLSGFVRIVDGVREQRAAEGSEEATQPEDEGKEEESKEDEKAVLEVAEAQEGGEESKESEKTDSDSTSDEAAEEKPEKKEEAE